MKRRLIFEISAEGLTKIFEPRLPPNTTILDMRWDGEREVWLIKATHESFPFVEEAAVIERRPLTY
jgi:hypothetical protein